MHTIIRTFFVTLGVVFFLLLLGVMYVWFSNTWQVQTLARLWFHSSDTTVMQEPVSEAKVEMETGAAASSSDISEGVSEATVSTEQTEAMTEAGVDESFFTSLSQTEVQCFRDHLGSARVDAIIAGSMPTTEEIIAGLPCVE